MTRTYIAGEVPANLNQLQHLQVLDLTKAGYEGPVVTRFDEPHELRVLRDGLNHFEGPMPESILSLTKLEELTLSGNYWNDTLQVLWLGSKLDFLNLVPWPDVSLWKSLEDLRLEGISFPRALFPTRILKLTKLRALHLERCNIMAIPSLESLIHLEETDPGNNTFSGHIPDMFGSMPNFTVLWLFDNRLSGPLPTSLWQCKRLRELIIFDKDLNGLRMSVGFGACCTDRNCNICTTTTHRKSSIETSIPTTF